MEYTESHTIVLTSPKLDLQPTKITDVVKFVKELILSNTLTVEYFNCELDNECDYIDEEMESKLSNTTHITFHFEHSTIDYKSYDSEGVLKFIYDKLDSNLTAKILVDGKDIEIEMH